MSNLIAYQDYRPQISSDVFLAPGSLIIGRVDIERKSSIWFNSVVRGDVERINIGQGTNIQDNSVVHCARDNGPTDIGDDVTIGHMALIHACTIQDRAFIGMQSIIMDYAVIETEALVAAGSLVTSGTVIGKRELWAGRPARFKRMLTQAEIDKMQENTRHYQQLAQNYLQKK